jgi:hypothetical protein
MKKPPALTSLVVSLVIGLGVGVFFSGQARAAETNVAVLGIEASEGVPEAVATAATDALRQRMSLTAGYRLVQGRDLVEVKLVFSCPDEAPACMGQAAKSLGAARLIFGSVKKAGADSFSLTIKLFDGEKEVVESWTTDQFTRVQSTAAGLRGPAQKWIATLTGQSLPGTVHIQGGVVGAQVSLDGVGVGVISANGLGISGVAPGRHEIVVSKPGYESAKKTITLSSADTRDVTIEMAPEPKSPGAEGAPVAADTGTPEQPPLSEAPVSEPPVTSSGDRIGTRIAAVVTAAAGVAGIIVGIRYSLLVNDANGKLDDFRRFDCVPLSKDIYGNGCNTKNEPVKDAITAGQWDWIQNTKKSADRYQTYQWIGYGLGGALLATSAYLFYRGFFASSSSSSVADARGPSLYLAPIFAPNSVGAAAFTTF